MNDVSAAESRSASRIWLVFAALVAVTGLVSAFVMVRAFGVDGIFEWIVAGWALLQAAPPIVFFGAMSILTVFPVPLTPFYITAGSIYGIGPSLLWIPPAIVLNNLIAYTLTTSFLRPWLQSIVERRGLSIPSVESKREQTLLIAMVRITPGPPYFMQSLVLGLAGVDRTRFLLLSLPVHMIFVVGFVVLGRSAFDGELGLGIFAIALILAGSTCARLVHKRLKRAGAPEVDSEPETAIAPLLD